MGPWWGGDKRGLGEAQWGRPAAWHWETAWVQGVFTWIILLWNERSVEL